MAAAVRAVLTGSLLCACVVTLAAFTAGDEKLGKGVSLPEATAFKSLYDTPDAFVGKTIRVDGIVSAVCQEMGCWMALADAKDPEAVVRFKVDHGTGIVFPISAKGKQASAEGVFEKIAATDAEGRNAAAEQASATAKTSAFGQTYQIKATGAIIK